MRRVWIFLPALVLVVLACGPANPVVPTALPPEPSPTPSHVFGAPWLLPAGQYLFVEAAIQIEGIVQSGNPTPGFNDNMPTYEFNPVTGVLLSKAGFMPPKDSKVIIGVRRSLRGVVGSGSSSIVTAYTKLPAVDPDVMRVVAVDVDGSARLGVGSDEFILKPQESKDINKAETQAAPGGSLKLTTKTHITNYGVQALSKIVAGP